MAEDIVRKVVLPVDGSKHSERAFNCKYFRLRDLAGPRKKPSLKLCVVSEIITQTPQKIINRTLETDKYSLYCKNMC